jgi:hypothetical protein
MTRPPDIFTKRGIAPDGEVARGQGFVHYAGPDWRARRAVVAAHESLYGSDAHPDEHKRRELWDRAVLRTERKLRRDGDYLGLRDLTLYLDADYVRHPEVARLNAYRHRLPHKVRTSWTYWLRKALAQDGWLLPRHAVMPNHERRAFSSRPAAQLRPDRPVTMGRGWEWHHHFYDLNRLEREAHEVKICDRAPDGHPASEDHPAGAYLPTGHLHPVTGELVVDADGRHRHWVESKYIYTPGNTAMRLGTNPVALERGWGGPDDLFVVVMEGTLKMCAVVEAGYPAIDAGSVTLWHGGTELLDPEDGGHLFTHTELEEFAARHLEGRPVAVVCDSDWHRNPRVWEQTRRVVELLQESGADAVACAPPEGESFGWAHPVTGVEMREKVGVDDWLGPEHGGALLDLVCQVPEGAATLSPDDPRLADGTYRSGRENTVRVLTAMGRNVLPGTDTAPFSKRDLAERLGMRPTTVEDAFNRGVERGLAQRITTARRQWLPGEGRGAMAAPVVRLVPEALPRHSEPTLGAWLAAR